MGNQFSFASLSAKSVSLKARSLARKKGTPDRHIVKETKNGSLELNHADNIL